MIANAAKVMRIATGEEADGMVDDRKDPAAKSLGARGGNARARALENDFKSPTTPDLKKLDQQGRDGQQQ